MRFLLRSLTGLLLASLTLGLLIMAGGVLMQATQDSRHNHARRPVEERVFAVTVAGIQLGPVTPVVTAYGHITSGETLQLRAAATGKVVRLAADFRDGHKVDALKKHPDHLFLINFQVE